MRFAVINGVRVEAQSGLKGECPGCSKPTVAKCGSQRVWHWAHKGCVNCDSWWENETLWHRAWKGQFPEDWQEIVHQADDGERHIADVKTWNGWTLEFQHSVISADERKSRESYYEALIWVVDGLRRKRDAQQFYAALDSGQRNRDPFSMKRRIVATGDAILRDWAGSRAHVFFDFGEQNRMWWQFPCSDTNRAYVQDISREAFIRIHNEKSTQGTTEFERRVDNFRAFVASFEAPPETPMPTRRSAEVGGTNRIIVARRKFRF